jgi:ketosteroid isomerase-like protein
MNVHPVVTSFLNAWKALDEEAYIAHFAEEFESIDPYGVARDEDGARQHIRQLRKYWTDLDYEVIACISEGDEVAVAYRIFLTGIGGGWKDKRLELECIAMVSIEDGRIRRWREQFDTAVFSNARDAAPERVA